MKKKNCLSCGGEFHCGADAGKCWCAELPRVMPLDFTKDCLCPECLKRAVNEKIAESSQRREP